jgi:ubiquinone/menaquinone biosynthesis C-methylase UbiE
MDTKRTGKHRNDNLQSSRLAFWMISLMHDNPLIPAIKKPHTTLEAAGLKPGQKVLEVGCGPGFYTIPAARIVGAEGMIYAVDVNPLAVKRIETKMRKYGMENIKPILGNAADCGIADGSIDLAFVFGLRYIAGGLSGLVSGIRDVLKTGGILLFERTTGSEYKLIQEVTGAGLTMLEKKGRILVFVKKENNPE